MTASAREVSPEGGLLACTDGHVTVDVGSVVALVNAIDLESDGTGRLHDVVNAPGVRVIELEVDDAADVQCDQ